MSASPAVPATTMRPPWRSLAWPLMVFALAVAVVAAYLAGLSSRLWGRASGPWAAAVLFSAATFSVWLAWRSTTDAERAGARGSWLFALSAYRAWAGLALLSGHGSLPRLFISGFAPLGVLGAGGLAMIVRLDHPAFRLAWLHRRLMVLLIAIAAAQIALTFGAPRLLAYSSGAVRGEANRGELLGWYAPAIYQVAALPAPARTEFLWELRALDCPDQTRCLGDAIIDRWYHLGRTQGSAEAVLAAWRQAGVTHILISDAGAAFKRQQPQSLLTAKDWAEFDRLRARLVLIKDFGGAYHLYRLDRLP